MAGRIVWRVVVAGLIALVAWRIVSWRMVSRDLSIPTYDTISRNNPIGPDRTEEARRVEREERWNNASRRIVSALRQDLVSKSDRR